MTSTQTTITIPRYLGALVALAMMAVMLMAAKPSHASTTFTVNSIQDTADLNVGDGRCFAGTIFFIDQCTLRAAIQEADANNNPTQVDRINFNMIGDGVHTIPLDSALPVMNEPLVVNGYSQPGASANTLARGTNARPLVEVTPSDGFSASNNHGGLTVDAPNSTVRGLVINRFPAFTPGIEVSPFVGGRIVHHVNIAGNFLGTNPSGTLDEGNRGTGVNLIGASNSTVGGASPAARNLISGNGLEGVFIQGTSDLGHEPANNNLVQGNLIGTQKDGAKPLANGSDGVRILDAAAGIHDTNGNSVLSNSIFANGGIGIDLVSSLDDQGSNINDAGDADSGPNRLQNKPSLGLAKTVSGVMTIKGSLNSRPNDSYTVQFFSSPSGNEGRTFVGQKLVKTDASGRASFIFAPANAVAAGQKVTATATRLSTGDTSEFSTAKRVVSG
jgi:CSLREA domain-containing protein